MKYYKIINSKIELTTEGKEALKILDVSLDELKDYPDKMLNKKYWVGNKTFIDQALDNGKGVTYLDDCRIPYQNDNEYNEYKNKQESFKTAKNIGKTIKGKTNFLSGDIDINEPIPNLIEKGRFPANLLVSDDSLNTGEILGGKSGTTPHQYQKEYNKSLFTANQNKPQSPSSYGDNGSFSRYFDIDKWYEKTIINLPDNIQKTFPFLITPKPATKEKNLGIDDTNVHCTIKPIKLMAYLIMLGSRENDIILDPFAGSGTTLVAAAMLNRNFVGIEMEKDYFKIIKERLNALPKYIQEYKEELLIKEKPKSHKFW